MALAWLGFAILSLLPVATAQFPIIPNYDQIIKGNFGDGFQVSFKQNSICETTPGVKSYSGYITTPPSVHSKTVVNSFFWFFESRNGSTNAPFVIAVGGGPGASSIASAVGDYGPCNVNPDSNSTTLNPWSFNNEANVLFIDQPDMVGFSYDQRVNGSTPFIAPAGQASPIIPETMSPLPEANATIGLGTWASQNMNNTANSTGDAAEIFWEDVQSWFQAFPQYVPKNKKISIWTESYGGRYAPQFASLFYEKNKQLAAGQAGYSQALELEFDNVGIINGWIDPVSHIMSYPAFAVNNTYDIQMVNSTVLEIMQSNLTSPGGCLDLISQCEAAATLSDPNDNTHNMTVDGLCSKAFLECGAGVQAVPIAVSGRTIDDISQTLGHGQPPYYNGFFAQAWVQQALGAAVNFTDNSGPILAAFASTGDIARAGQLAHIGKLLDAGVYVTLVNGDLDYQLNWFGGEAASLQICWDGMDEFKNAGYAQLRTNATYIGGAVRQAGRLSFTRTFQAGHQGPVYQPETYFRIFDRTIKHLDLPDGIRSMEVANGMTLATDGPSSILNIRQKAPPRQDPICYQLAASGECTPEQLEVIESGNATFRDWVLQE